MHIVCYYPYYSCSCTFWPYHPYFFNLYCCILYLFVFTFMSSIATDLSQRGVVYYTVCVQTWTCLFLYSLPKK